MEFGIESLRPFSKVSKDFLHHLQQSHPLYSYEDGLIISQKTLQNLASFADKIELPKVIGAFNNDSHYLKTLELVSKSTFETQHRISFFFNKIISSLKVKKSLLDIGPGDGLLTLALADYFENLTVVENRDYILKKLESCLDPFVRLQTINKSILDLKIDSCSFNLAILSHLLHTIDSKHWLELINEVYNSLEPEGMLVIVMDGDELAKGKLMEYFGSKALNINQLAEDCKKIFGEMNTYFHSSNESFIAYSKTAMFHISSYMLADANCFAKKGDLEEYIVKNLQFSDHHFEMTTRQKYIIIKKSIR